MREITVLIINVIFNVEQILFKFIWCCVRKIIGLLCIGWVAEHLKCRKHQQTFTFYDTNRSVAYL